MQACSWSNQNIWDEAGAYQFKILTPYPPSQRNTELAATQ